MMWYKIKSFEEKKLTDRLNESNYTEMLTYMIELEDLTAEKEMTEFDKTDQLFSFRRGFIVLAVIYLLVLQLKLFSNYFFF